MYYDGYNDSSMYSGTPEQMEKIGMDFNRNLPYGSPIGNPTGLNFGVSHAVNPALSNANMPMQNVGLGVPVGTQGGQALADPLRIGGFGDLASVVAPYIDRAQAWLMQRMQPGMPVTPGQMQNMQQMLGSSPQQQMLAGFDNPYWSYNYSLNQWRPVDVEKL